MVHLINIHLFLMFVNLNQGLYIRICAESSKDLCGIKPMSYVLQRRDFSSLAKGYALLILYAGSGSNNIDYKHNTIKIVILIRRIIFNIILVHITRIMSCAELLLLPLIIIIPISLVIMKN